MVPPIEASAADPARPGSTGQLMRATRLIATALISCTLVATAVHTVLQAAKPAIFASPRKLLDAAADPETNVVFFGSSRVEDGIIPDVFDETAGRVGIARLHSYNLAQQDRTVIESAADAETLFGLRPEGIRFVFFEPNFGGQLTNSAANTMRAINYFTVGHAYRAIEMMDSSLLQRMPISQTAYLSNVLSATLRHYFSVGLAWAVPENSGSRFSGTSRGFPDLDPYGYRVLTPDDQYRGQIQALSAPPRANLISNGQLAVVLSFAALIEAHGGVPIMIGTPTSSDLASGFFAKFTERCAGKGPTYFDLNSPTEYPALWDPRNRQDHDHLNAAGAAIFTRMLAERLAAAIKDGSISLPLCGG